MLSRFVSAQQDVYERALAELNAGQKTSHWMWFIWPQLRELGRSETAKFYGIAGLVEAEAYLVHPVLGSRLIEISNAMASHTDREVSLVLGKVDAMKLRSSMTLFGAVQNAPPIFARILDQFYQGERCPLTLEALAGD